jgi:small subunit ribosomal protein S3
VPAEPEKYTIAEILNRVTNNGSKEVYNLLVCFDKTDTAAGTIYGHVLFVYGIIDGTVYFTEGGNMFGVEAGEPMECSIAQFSASYATWTDFEGVIVFGNKDYLDNCTVRTCSMFATCTRDVALLPLPDVIENGTIQRTAAKVNVTVYTAKPGIVIGKGGAGVEALKKEIEVFTGKQVGLDIIEIKNPDCDAQLVAENIAQQLEKRISFRRAMKQTIGRAMKSGAKGIKTTVSGRLGGADIARSEGYHEGSIPLQTLRANIDYGFAEAKTTYGRIGIKVWIYKGQVLSKENKLIGNVDLPAPRENRRRFDGKRRQEGGK